jgi:hypothetical protein
LLQYAIGPGRRPMLHLPVENISAEERAKTCETMTESRDRMAALDGKQPAQLRMYLPPPNDEAAN